MLGLEIALLVQHMPLSLVPCNPHVLFIFNAMCVSLAPLAHMSVMLKKHNLGSHGSIGPHVSDAEKTQPGEPWIHWPTCQRC
jgi:hypothetical protein